MLLTGIDDGGDHGWNHSTVRAKKPTRHPIPVNGYRAMLLTGIDYLGRLVIKIFDGGQ